MTCFFFLFEIYIPCYLLLKFISFDSFVMLWSVVLLPSPSLLILETQRVGIVCGDLSFNSDRWIAAVTRRFFSVPVGIWVLLLLSGLFVYCGADGLLCSLALLRPVRHSFMILSGLKNNCFFFVFFFRVFGVFNKRSKSADQRRKCGGEGKVGATNFNGDDVTRRRSIAIGGRKEMLQFRHQSGSWIMNRPATSSVSIVRNTHGCGARDPILFIRELWPVLWSESIANDADC